MTNVEFLDDLERRSKDNGGLPIAVRGEDIHRLWCLANLKPYRGNTELLSSNKLKPLIKKARERIVNQTTFALNPVKWQCNDGRQIYPSQMDASHLRNTYRLLYEERVARRSCNGLSNVQWRRVFENEMACRGIAR